MGHEQISAKIFDSYLLNMAKLEFQDTISVYTKITSYAMVTFYILFFTFCLVI